MTELSQKLDTWSADNPGEQGEFAKQLAAGLRDPSKASLWSLIDIPAEFERRSSNESTYFFISILQKVPFVRNNKTTIKLAKALNSILRWFDKVLPLFIYYQLRSLGLASVMLCRIIKT